MVIYVSDMTISVTEFKARCLQILRELENSGEVLEIERRGRVVARLVPVGGDTAKECPPWHRLRGTGELRARADESAMTEQDFEAGH